MRVKASIFVTISFLLTIGTSIIAGLHVPAIEKKSRDIQDSTDQLQNRYFLETQRYGQNSLNFSAAAQILSSERILYIVSDGKNKKTRETVLDQGKIALLKGLMERKFAIESVISALRAEGKEISDEIPSIPEESIGKLFATAESPQAASIDELRSISDLIQKRSLEYDQIWTKATDTTLAKLSELKANGSDLDAEASFWMKVALLLQIVAMIFIFIKDSLSE